MLFQIDTVSCKCANKRHSKGCGCLSDAFLTQARVNHFCALMQAKSPPTVSRNTYGVVSAPRYRWACLGGRKMLLPLPHPVPMWCEHGNATCPRATPLHDEEYFILPTAPASVPDRHVGCRWNGGGCYPPDDAPRTQQRMRVAIQSCNEVPIQE